MRASFVPEGGCARGEGTEKSSYLCPEGSRASQSASENSQILSFTPSSHLGNDNLYLQTVGAGGDCEFLKRSPSLPVPLSSLAWPAWPLAFFPSPSSALFISARASLGHLLVIFKGPLPHPLFIPHSPCYGTTAVRECIRPPPPQLMCLHSMAAADRGSRSTSFSTS